MRFGPSGPFPLLNAPLLMKPSSNNPGFGSLEQQQQQKRPKPCFPSMPDLPRSLPRDAGWVTEVGDFVCVHLINHGVVASSSGSAGSRRRGSRRRSGGGGGSSSGRDGKRRLFAPDSRPDDGCLWLLLVRAGVARKDLVAFLKSAERRLEGSRSRAAEAGASSDGGESRPPSEGIELLRVRGLRLAPLDVHGFGGFSVDGAPAADGDPLECLQAFVMPGVARTLVK